MREVNETDFKKKTGVSGMIFVLLSLVLLYGDSFMGVFGDLYALPTFGYFLPRLIDFLFYGGLILITLSVMLTKPKK